jgi:hypothetical protein
MKKYSQEEQDQILNKLNKGAIGKRKEWVWDRITLKQTWSKDKVLEVAKKYNNPDDFHTNEGGAAGYARRKDFWEEATAHMDKRNEWDLNLVKQIAKLYKTRNDFAHSKPHSGAYDWAKRHNKLDEVCAHMSKFYKDKAYYYEIAKQYKTRGEFWKYGSYAYKKANKEGWLDEWFPKNK